jgi:hypothetical protein
MVLELANINIYNFEFQCGWYSGEEPRILGISLLEKNFSSIIVFRFQFLFFVIALTLRTDARNSIY